MLLTILLSHITLGAVFIASGVLVFAYWREELLRCAEGHERKNFLLHDVVGGSWVLAVVLVCAGLYFLASHYLPYLQR